MDVISAAAPIDLGDLDALLIESSRLMKEGIRLVDEAPGAALACFDRALDLRRRLPIEDVAVLRYDLAACWLNRAEALVRLANSGDDAHHASDPAAPANANAVNTAADRVGAALKAYDEALVLLRTVPLDDDPRFVRRLAIAWQNRGRLLASRTLRSRDAHDTREAVASFVEAIGVLEQHGAHVTDRQPMLAAVWMNAAAALMADEHPLSPIQAARAARLAIALIEPLEKDDADAADVGLNARHVLCRVLAATPLAGDDIHEATDLADDALALVEHWERREVTRFRALAADFFRFGAHVYAAHQPGFLREFIQEHLDPARSSQAYVDSADIRRAADDTSALQPATYYVTVGVHIVREKKA